MIFLSKTGSWSHSNSTKLVVDLDYAGKWGQQRQLDVAGSGGGEDDDGE